ncbi:ABC transporter permease [Blastococcus sp. Marseille-P5729]|uniref:ABC transporter permease n=1 Tax=Blastococcus sp. Marseille-P5729 TaxID=2086582 RepID=UPI000D0F82CA|nr:ABC transporter permease [Blastococcus sp. Marseille-P5729]
MSVDHARDLDRTSRTAVSADPAEPTDRGALRSAASRGGRDDQSGWYALLGAVAAVATWYLLTDLLLAHRPLMHEFSPTRTWSGVVELWETGVLVDDASASVMRLVVGLAIAILVGIVAGVLIGSVSWLERTTRPVVGFLRMVSPLSWAPLVIVLVGIGDLPVIALVALTTVWPVMLAALAGVRAVNPGHLAVARTLGATRWETLRSVIAPSLRPHLLTGVRAAVALGWVVLVPAEMLGVTSGLGYQILNAKDQLAYHHITALIVVIGVIGLAIDVVARWALRTPRERRAEAGVP